MLLSPCCEEENRKLFIVGAISSSLAVNMNSDDESSSPNVPRVNEEPTAQDVLLDGKSSSTFTSISGKSSKRAESNVSEDLTPQLFLAKVVWIKAVSRVIDSRRKSCLWNFRELLVLGVLKLVVGSDDRGGDGVNVSGGGGGSGGDDDDDNGLI